MKHVILFVLLSVLAGAVCAATDLEALAQRCPSGTIGFIATSGTEDFGAAFRSSIAGQIASDPQVKSFFEQLFASVSKLNDEDSAKAQDFLDFAEQVFRSPTIGAISIDPVNNTDRPTFFLISRTVTDSKEFNAALEKAVSSIFDAGDVQKQTIAGSTVYTSADPSQRETVYMAQSGEYFILAGNDGGYSLLSNGPANTQLAGVLSRVPASQDAVVGYVDVRKIMALAEEEVGQDFETIKSVLQSLGLQDVSHALMHAGFEGKNIVAQNLVKTPTSEGIWNALGRADRGLFNYVDPRALQACVFQVDPAVLYDTVMTAIARASADTAQEAQEGIAEVEAMLDFRIREDLLANIEGSFMGYALPVNASPELMSGGYVIAARLKDAQKVEKCLLNLGSVIQSFGQQQVQVTSQQTADGKTIHIWAVTLMAMMQIIPSWSIEGDMLIFTSHPSVTKSAVARFAAGQQDSLVSDARFTALLSTVPNDAIMISLMDSKTNARQLMQMLQRFWPMMNMGLMQEGIQLPIMLPSIDAYIEQMEPGLRYARKTSDGIESFYMGTGLEAGAGGVAGGAMGLAVLMPALNRTKKIAQRVVSGTNLKEVGLAAIVYANDHDGKFPSTLNELTADYDVSEKTLTSPRKPDDFQGPSYILVPGLTDAAPASAVLAYENPAFVEDDQVNVLYTDGHVAAESKETLKQNLKTTYEHLGKPMPEIDWGN